MPKITTPLTDTEIKKSKTKDKDYKLGDGQGLYLVIKKNGTKFFRFDYKLFNKRKSMSFGIYPEITLKEARVKREKTRDLIKNGIDPINSKNNQNTTTFEDIIAKWLEIMKAEWKDNTYNKTKSALLNYTTPLKKKDIKDITRTDILDVIRNMEILGIYESSNRLLNNLNRIYKYAVTYNYVEHNIIADIDKANTVKSPIKKNFPAITDENGIRELVNDIKSFREFYKADLSTIHALELAPYVFLRPSNLRFLEWTEVIFDKEFIFIPKEKMKNGKDFVLPLSKSSIDILNKIKLYSFHNSKYVFPAPTSNHKPLSDATLNHSLAKLGYKNKMTSHGFRSMFSTIAHEKTKEHGQNSDVIEACLAHTEPNKIKAAYNRENKMKYFDEKKELVDWWDNWLN